MSEPEKMTPVILYVPMATSREVEGHLTKDSDGKLVLVIGDRARGPGDKFEGHDLSFLDIDPTGDDLDDLALTDLWTNTCREAEYERREKRREKEEGTPFPPTASLEELKEEPMPNADTRALLSVLPRGIWHASQGALDGRPVAEVFALQIDIPALDARVGDFLVWTGTEERLLSEVRGHLHAVPRSQYASLASEVARGAVRFVDGSLRKSCDQLTRDLRDRRRHRGSDATSWCWIIRPWHCVSDPITAGTDDAALFELIHSAGGRMPEG